MTQLQTRHILTIFATLCLAAFLGAVAAPEATAPKLSAANWKTDPAWYKGKAEWALYDAVRPIYGAPRRYEATIFTNKQQQDPKTTTKAGDWRAARNIEVFKHNVSEMIPTENYTYRFLTTAFVRTSDLVPYKLVASTQEDCGSTYKQFVNSGGTVSTQSFSYFPDEGSMTDRYRAPAGLDFHDALTLTLRDYPFDADVKPEIELQLVPDQTHTHQTNAQPAPATVSYVSRETVTVPYGEVETHHLRVDHAPDGGTSHSEYWFAADSGMRHVLVKYQGPYGLRYELKRLDWWAYWSEPRPQ